MATSPDLTLDCVLLVYKRYGTKIALYYAMKCLNPFTLISNSPPTPNVKYIPKYIRSLVGMFNIRRESQYEGVNPL